MVAGIIVTCWAARFIPGFLGEWFGIVSGIATTPFLMEGSLILLGFMIVLALNAWRQHREGDELVYLEQVEGPGSDTFPEQARQVLYDSPPLDPETPAAAVRLEGALDIGDHESAAEILMEMPDEERAHPDVMRLRVRLAEATGKSELARRLRDESPHGPTNDR